MTKPLIFQGSRLVLNMATSAAGSIRIEFEDADGTPAAGFALSDCVEIFGNRLEAVVKWKSGADVSGLAGQPVRIRFALKDADVYSFQFVGQ